MAALARIPGSEALVAALERRVRILIGRFLTNAATLSAIMAIAAIVEAVELVAVLHGRDRGPRGLTAAAEPRPSGASCL
jgi:hypothetical protein